MVHYGGVEKQTYRNDLFVQQTMDLTIYAALTPESLRGHFALNPNTNHKF